MQTWPDPLLHFNNWYAKAQQVEGLDYPAMVLATASLDARPSARVVYFKGLVTEGFSFYSNYHSRKGQELAANAHAALLFYWQPLARQIRIEGTVQKLSRQASARYFASRSLDKQISASISKQSSEIASYQSLQEKFSQAQKQYAGQQGIPCPSHWGGYALTPSRFEFYIADDSRLNQRVLYKRTSNDEWHSTCLAP